MMNKDTILKYLSGLMNREEVMDFEQRLKSDSSLGEEYEKIKTKLNQLSLQNEIEDDTAYFNNLLPKVKTKIDSRERGKAIRFAPAFSFLVAALIVFLLQFPRYSEKPLLDSLFSEQDLSTILLENDDSTLTDYLEIGLFENSNYLISENGDDITSFYIDQTLLDEIGFESASYYGEYGYYEERTDYSEEEAILIYNELIDKKIL